MQQRMSNKSLQMLRNAHSGIAEAIRRVGETEFWNVCKSAEWLMDYHFYKFLPYGRQRDFCTAYVAGTLGKPKNRGDFERALETYELYALRKHPATSIRSYYESEKAYISTNCLNVYEKEFPKETVNLIRKVFSGDLNSPEVMVAMDSVREDNLEFRMKTPETPDHDPGMIWVSNRGMSSRTMDLLDSAKFLATPLGFWLLERPI